MENPKYLVINSAVCDARQIREETLASYEKIIFNSGVILVNQETRLLLNRYPIVLNGEMIETDEVVTYSKLDGDGEIGPGQVLQPGKIVLKVNGNLRVAPGSEETLKNYLRIKVNGNVTCPESLAGLLSTVRLKVNGTLRTYPDGAIPLKDTTLLDRTFHLRAKENACYYASRRVVALAPDIDFTRLTEKKVRFVTRELLVAESLVETALPLFDERAEIVILPDGCAYLSGDVTLDENLLRRHGGKLYVKGDLTIPRESAHLLPQLTFLMVKNNVRLPQALIPAFLELDAQYSELKPVRGILIEDRLSFTVDRALLESAADGLTISDCVNVKFKEDIPPQLIRERLRSLEECVNVSCTEDQRAAIEPVAVEVVRLGSGSGGRMGELLQNVLGGMMSPVTGTKARVINGDTYTL